MLALLRRAAPLLLLLTALVVTERLDLLPCPEASCTFAAPPSTDPGATADPHGCLCHPTLLPAAPVVAPRVLLRTLRWLAPPRAPLPEGALAPPEPVPLG